MTFDKDSPQNRRKDFGLRIMFTLALALMLFAGLTPGEYRFRNEVSWIEKGPGLRFDRFGIAYTPPFLTASAARSLNQSGVTLLLSLMLEPDAQSRFRFIASFHNGDDGSQLVVAQWRKSLIVMHGDDYSYVRRTPRVSADLTSYLDRPILLAISTSPSGTLISIDGEIVGSDTGVQILLPVGARDSRLALGNSPRANNGWTGTLFGFGVLSRPLKGPELKAYQGEWLKTRNLKFVPPSETLQLLHFDEKSGDIVRDFSGAANNAMLPPRLTPVERSLLADGLPRDLLRKSSLLDITVNLLGFIPFGLLLAVMLSNRGYQAGHVVIAVVLCGFVFSLGIETVQAWIPTRSSSSVDLLLNILGAAIGAVGSRTITR